jgi:lipopolysaccharide export system permease protein
MRILSRYFLVRFSLFFAVTLVVLFLAVLAAEMLLNLDEVFEAEQGLLGVMTYLLLKVPASYFALVAPVAAFAATFVSLGLAARRSELVAVKAGGVSPLRVCWPILGVAVLLAGASLAVNETLVVQAAKSWERAYRGVDHQIAYKRGAFWVHRGELIYHYRGADPETKTLYRVRIFEVDARGRLVRSVEAREARIGADGTWHLQEALTRRFEPDQPTAPIRTEAAAELTLPGSSEQDLALLEANAASLSLRNLDDYIEVRRRDGDSVERFQALFHSRLAEPLAVLLFALFAIPFALSVERQRTLAIPALGGVLVVAAFLGLRSVATTLALQGAAPAAATPWTLLALFGGLGLWRLLRVAR